LQTKLPQAAELTNFAQMRAWGRQKMRGYVHQAIVYRLS
jgi:hypothetical protein